MLVIKWQLAGGRSRHYPVSGIGHMGCNMPLRGHIN